MTTIEQPPRLLAVSDIHGHADGLLRLLAAADYNAEQDQLVLLGDYINAAPSTWGTLELIQRLTEGGAIALLGNLEVALLRSGDEAAALLPAERLDWLSGLPYYAALEGWLFVHAGLRPGVPLDQQHVDDLTGIREAFWAAEPLGGDPIVFGHTPTFKLGASPGTIWQSSGRLGIDTGAKHGYRLTLLDLTHSIAYSCSTSLDSLYEEVRQESLHLSL